MTSKKEIDALHPSEIKFNALVPEINKILAEAEKTLGIKEKIDPSDRPPDVARIISLDE